MIRVSAHTMRAAVVCAVIGLLMFTTTQAWASSGAPQWTVSSVSRPTNFCPAGSAACEASSGKDSYHVTVTNTGDAASDGSPVTMIDELPQGLGLDPAGASGEDRLVAIHNNEAANAKFKCFLSTCTYTGAVVPGDTLVLTFPVDVSENAPASVTNVVRVAGGGAPDASMSTTTSISTQEASFGIPSGGATSALSTVQAGAHPDFTTSIAFDTVNARGALAGDPKDTTDNLPPGFAGDLVDTPACTDASFSLHECPIDTQIGVTTLTLDIFGAGPITFTEPVYNLTPDPGEVAKLGFDVGVNLVVSPASSIVV